MNAYFEFLSGGIEAATGKSLYWLVAERPDTRCAADALNAAVEQLLADPKTRDIGLEIDSEVGNLLCVCVQDSVEVLAQFLDGLPLKLRDK
jgi:hypothetical protein